MKIGEEIGSKIKRNGKREKYGKEKGIERKRVEKGGRERNKKEGSGKLSNR